MKHVFTTILLCLVAMVATAETWTDANGVTYDFGTDDVNGKRKAYINKIENCPKNLVIPDKVYIGTTAYEVYRLSGNYNCIIADEGKNNIESIVMPNTITSIGDYCFSGCTSLKQVTLSTSLQDIGYYAFGNCTSLKQVSTSPVLQSIGGNAFDNCTSLKTIEVSATTIGREAFKGCSSLQNVVLTGPITTIKESTFKDCTSLLKINLPSTLTTIEKEAFYNCTSLEIKAPASLISIGENAFYGSNIIHMTATTPPTLKSSNLINATALVLVPETLLTTYQTAPYWSGFANRIQSEHSMAQREVTVTADKSKSSLHVAIGEKNLAQTVSLKVNGTINSYDIMLIRNKMINLKYLDLSNASVIANSYEYYTGYCTHDNMLENYAFSELGLKVLHLPKNLISIHDCCTNCKGLDSVYCQMGLQSIGNKAFDGCTNLRHVDIKEGLTEIGTNAFAYTSSLETIKLPNSLETIGDGAFFCTGLTSITIPANVQNMGTGAFMYGDIRWSIDCQNYDNNGKQSGTWQWEAGEYRNGNWKHGGKLEHVIFAPSCKLRTLPKYTFVGQERLLDISWPTNMETLEFGSVAYCTSLKNRQFPEGLKTIKEYALEGCTSLDTIVLPPHLEAIESNAFRDCSNMDVIKISSSVYTINNFAFAGCPKVSKVYTYTVEPTNILQQTFDCYQVADLYVPRTSYLTYFYNTQWSQFLHLIEFDEAYDYFYLNGDYELGGEHGTIEGNPDVDINPGGGLIIYGDSTLNFGDITITGTPETGSSIISDDNIDIDTLRLNLLESKGKWHFLTFPFDINREDVKCRSEFVIRYYDGNIRAQNGSGGWQNTPVGKPLKNAQGYIFQPRENDTLQLVFKHPKFPTTDVSTPLNLYAPADPTHTWDANWNLVGNPYMSYYDLDSIMHSGFNYPVICWNGTGYDTYRPGDDHYHFLPFEAFFVQNATLSQMTFPISGRETRIQANKKLYGDDKQPSAAPARQAYTCTQNDGRQMINLALSDDTYTDRTRVVFNATATTGYEIGTDAVKFFAGNPSPVQLYTIGAQNEEYSINERPATTGGEVIRIGYYAPQAGMLTLSATRMDTTICIYDNELHQEVDLTTGDYTFYSDAGHNRTRFSLAAKAPSITTSLDQLSEAEATDVTVYTTTGVLVAEHAAIGDLHLAAGVYLVKTNMGTKKIVVR